MKSTSRLFVASLLFAFTGALFVVTPARAQTLTTLHVFTGSPNDGAAPYGALVRDAAGSFYGTTSLGGAHVKCGKFGCGTIFRVDSTGKETILYNFCSEEKCVDGSVPVAGLIRDDAGNLYGTTEDGGNPGCSPNHGCGVVFEFDTTGKERVLHRFCSEDNCADGSLPYASLIFDPDGNLYGTTASGGAYNAGAVFRLDRTGHEIVLYSFTGGTDGGYPETGLLRDSAGSLYGTTTFGGIVGYGVAFRLAPSGQETVLHSFCSSGNCADGSEPSSSLILDENGNLYGTTSIGGSYACNPRHGCGVVFEIDPSGNETVLRTFADLAADGAYPAGRLVRNVAGTIYGSTPTGGKGIMGGVVFRLDTTGREAVLHNFCSLSDCADGESPNILVRDVEGNAYSTTSQGGDPSCYCGTVFEISPK